MEGWVVSRGEEGERVGRRWLAIRGDVWEFRE